MNTALQLKNTLQTVDHALLAYKDLTIAELVETNELDMFYRLKEDKVLLLKALEQFGDFMARRECQLKLKEAEFALTWVAKLKRNLK